MWSGVTGALSTRVQGLKSAATSLLQKVDAALEDSAFVKGYDDDGSTAGVGDSNGRSGRLGDDNPTDPSKELEVWHPAFGIAVAVLPCCASGSIHDTLCCHW